MLYNVTLLKLAKLSHLASRRVTSRHVASLFSSFYVDSFLDLFSRWNSLSDSEQKFRVYIFFKKWAIPGLFFFIFIFSIQLT